MADKYVDVLTPSQFPSKKDVADMAKEILRDSIADDQEAKADAGKLQLTLVPQEIIRDIAIVREYGVTKYPKGGRDNWKRVSVERYRDAAYRHWLAYLEDPYGVDEESGLPHLYHWLCNAAFIAELEKEHFKR